MSVKVGVAAHWDKLTTRQLKSAHEDAMLVAQTEGIREARLPLQGRYVLQEIGGRNVLVRIDGLYADYLSAESERDARGCAVLDERDASRGVR